MRLALYLLQQRELVAATADDVLLGAGELSQLLLEHLGVEVVGNSSHGAQGTPGSGGADSHRGGQAGCLLGSALGGWCLQLRLHFG